MNPKDMTEEALFEACITAVRAWPDARTVDEGDRLWKLYKDTKAEILDRLARRIDEADVLRKENEELLKDKERIDFLDDGNYGIDPRNIPGVMMNGRRFHCLAGRGDWSSLRDAIDAARLAKESEASHE